MNLRPLRGLYHVALVVLSATSFNWAFDILTHVNISQRLFQGVVDVPINYIALGVCVSAVVVLWYNWVD
jgi:hypothetical protein